jgi:hypothetical protein
LYRDITLFLITSNTSEFQLTNSKCDLKEKYSVPFQIGINPKPGVFRYQ